LWNELSLLENRLASQRMNILNVQLNLDEDEIDMFQGEGESVLELKKTESFQARNNDKEDVKYEDTSV
jgi:hypothetical protein